MNTYAYLVTYSVPLHRVYTKRVVIIESDDQPSIDKAIDMCRLAINGPPKKPSRGSLGFLSGMADVMQRATIHGVEYAGQSFHYRAETPAKKTKPTSVRRKRQHK